MPGGCVEEALGPERVGVGIDVGVVVEQVARWRPGRRRAGSSSRRPRSASRPAAGAVFGSTGRRRSVSWIVAVRYASPSPASISSTQPVAAPRGARGSRSNAQASEDAVVSCPATSSVISSSRSSWSDIGEPSSWRASSSIASTSSRSPRARARRSSISSKISASTSLLQRRGSRPNGPTALEQRLASRSGGGRQQADRLLAEREHLAEPVAQRVEPRAGVEAEDGAQDDLERQRAASAGAARSGSSRGQRGDLALGRPRPIRPSSRSIRSPWKAGSISLRCSMCASPSSRITELRADDRLRACARPRRGAARRRAR